MTRKLLSQAIAEQRDWMDRCGGSLTGYIEHYGDPGIPPIAEDGEPQQVRIKEPGGFGLEPVPGEPGMYFMRHFGNGGSAIYAADLAELARLLAMQARGRKYV